LRKDGIFILHAWNPFSVGLDSAPPWLELAIELTTPNLPSVVFHRAWVDVLLLDPDFATLSGSVAAPSCISSLHCRRLRLQCAASRVRGKELEKGATIWFDGSLLRFKGSFVKKKRRKAVTPQTSHQCHFRKENNLTCRTGKKTII
jgi:hypothetical protein